ncbi:MAG: hypothetical protein IJO52_06375 [Clostridia bacterium]|nr:hypothetical protein [Clostridia bacterium]
MKKKYILILFVICACIPLVKAFLTVAAWVLIAIAFQFSSETPMPMVTYGEFPFRLVYEIDGEIFEINDAYVCEFDGFSSPDGAAATSRVWKTYLKSGNERTTLLKTDEFEIFCSKINAYIYMNEPDYIGKAFEKPIETHPTIRFVNDFEKRAVSSSEGELTGIYNIQFPKSLTDDEAWEEYKLRIISWECPPPIENKFE